jgi:hypothetical protein
VTAAADGSALTIASLSLSSGRPDESNFLVPVKQWVLKLSGDVLQQKLSGDVLQQERTKYDERCFKEAVSGGHQQQ